MLSAFCFKRAKVFLAVPSLFIKNAAFFALLLNFGLYQKKYASADRLAINNSSVAVSLKKIFMEVLSGVDA